MLNRCFSPLRPRSWCRKWVLPVSLCVLSFGISATLILKISGTPETDAYYYHLLAESVFSPHPYQIGVKHFYLYPHEVVHPDSTFAPLYPLLLAVVHLALPGLTTNLLLTAMLVAGLLALVYILARSVGLSHWVGTLAIAMVMFSPRIIRAGLSGMSEPLTMCLMVASMLSFLVWVQEGDNWRLFLVGGLVGLTALTRNALMLLLFVLLVLSYLE